MSSLAELLTEIRDLRKDVQNLSNETAARNATCAAHQARTGNLEKTTYGNGTPGIRRELDQVSNDLRIIRYIGSVTIAVVTTIAARLIYDFLTP